MSMVSGSMGMSTVTHSNEHLPSDVFTVMGYNVLADIHARPELCARDSSSQNLLSFGGEAVFTQLENTSQKASSQKSTSQNCFEHQKYTEIDAFLTQLSQTDVSICELSSASCFGGKGRAVDVFRPELQAMLSLRNSCFRWRTV